MQGYASREMFSRQVKVAYHLTVGIVQSVPDKLPNGDWVRCHELTRAIAQGLMEPECRHVVVDGQYAGVAHSWLMYPGMGSNGHPLILDCYVPGRMPCVALTDTWMRLGSLYEAGPLRTDIDGATTNWLFEHYVRWRVESSG